MSASKMPSDEAVKSVPGAVPRELALVLLPAGASDPFPIRRGLKQLAYRANETLPAVGQQNVLAVARRQSFGAERRRDHGRTGGPGLDDLQPGSTAGQQRHYGDFGGSEVWDGVLHRPGTLDARLPAHIPLDCFGIAPDQTPGQIGPPAAQRRPDFSGEVTHGCTIGLVFERSGKDDAIPLGYSRGSNQWNRVWI